MLKATHKLQALQAYDEAGLPIKPSHYRRVLPGSVVRLSLTFQAFAIGTCVFALTCEIQELHILQRGKPVRSSQEKRKFEDAVSDRKMAKKVKA